MSKGMDIRCHQCKGACCEGITIPVTNLSTDAKRWLMLHKGVSLNDQGIVFDNPCEQLGEDGKCKIYNSRPQGCVDYEVNSTACQLARLHRR